jgi:serine/threonine protein kinase/Tol biopolymer transport system component
MRETRDAAPAGAAAGPSDLRHLLDRFEEAWRNGTPRIDDFLPHSTAKQAASRQRLLLELVAIDLECRWRRAAGSEADKRPRLEDYAVRYGELRLLERLPLELIGHEYRVRHCCGDRPTHAEYCSRFPHHGPELQQELARVDAELAAEFSAGHELLWRPSRPGAAPQAPLASVAALIEAIKVGSLLEPAQLKAITGALHKQFANPQALGKELMRRGWLTPYQVNQLLQGRGPELVLGSYLLLERLGQGGAGQVFKARHQKMNRLAAIKVIRKELLTDTEVVGRFYREIQILSRLDHPNVVHAYDAGPAGPTHFLAMEFVEGTDLGKLVKQGGPMPVMQACEYIRQAALGLQHAHERGLVHRDIKPHNLIMSVRDGLIKVADLGLGRLPRGMTDETTLASTGAMKSTGTLTPENASLIGTADYLAPEQALDFHQADIRADIYSLGCTVYYLLTGQAPFAGGTLAQTVARHMNAEPPLVEQRRNDLVPGLSAVLRKMLAKRPEDRYQTPGEVAAVLAGMLKDSSHSGAGKQGKSEPKSHAAIPASWRNRKRIFFLGACSLVVLALAAVFFIGLFDKVPWSLYDRLVPEDIPKAYRPDPMPAGLVAAFGEIDSGAAGIRSLVCRPDGTVLCVDAHGNVWAWDLTKPPPERQKITDCKSTRAAVLSADGSLIAAADLEVQVWAVAGREARGKTAALTAQVNVLQFSPDNRRLAAFCEDYSIRLWELSGIQPEKIIPIPKVPIYVKAMAFSLDGRTLAFAGNYGKPTVYLLDLTHLKESFTGQFTELPGHRTVVADAPWGIHALAFAPDGRSLASGSSQDQSVRLWDMAHLPESNACEGDAGRVTSLVFSPKGKTLASADDKGQVILWDTASKKKVRQWEFSGSGVSTLAFAPDGRHLLVGMATRRIYVLRVDATKLRSSPR